MERWVDKVAIVTGATAGFGKDIAIQLVKRKIKVVGLARRAERLDELKTQLINEPGEFYSIVCDVTKHDDIVKAIDWIKQNLGGVDILINNAGIWPELAGLCDGSIEFWKKILDTNVLGLAMMTQEVVKLMTERKVAGHIININSTLGHKIPAQIANMMNMYGASKHAVTAISETLRLELAQKKSKIKVTSISPGLANTELYGSPQTNEMVANMLEITALEASDVTDAILYVLSTPARTNVSEVIIHPTGDSL